ncbi:MAG TPA: hypothetical protein VGK04_03790 [Thermoanaerobaculia bacterium]|jgi:hypothetical protein
MSRRVSRPAAALLALVISLSAPSAFAAASRDRGMDPDIGTRIVKVIKSLAKKFGISTNEDVIWIGPSKP